MNIVNTISIILTLLAGLSSCEVDNVKSLPEADYLIGSWVNPQATDSIICYERSESLNEQEYGFTFLSGNAFIERKNAGWCATPPIYYADFEGSWSRDESVLEIAVGYWGGMARYRWEIISVDNTTLKIIRAEQEYHRNIYSGMTP